MTSINGFRQPPQQYHPTPSSPDPSPTRRAMPTMSDSFAAIRLIRWWAWIPIAVIMGPVMAWSSVSIFDAVAMLGVPRWCAWIPAAALDGVMLLMTPWSVNEFLDREIQQWAKGIVAGSIFGSVAVGFIDHYFNSPSPEPLHKVLSGLVGAAPNLIAALVVHLLNKIIRQQTRQNREKEQERLNHETELAEARRDLSTVQGVRATEKEERDALAKEREQGHKDRLAQEARHRQERSDAEIADATRLQQARDTAATAAATRTQQGLRQACNKVALLHATLAWLVAAVAAKQDQARQAAEERERATAAAHARADEHEEAAAQAESRTRESMDRAAEMERETERLRSKARRARERLDEATTSRPSSQPVLQQDPTLQRPVSQPSLQQRPTGVAAVSRAERREWAYQQIVSGEWEREFGRELRGADIDNKFGLPRTGAAILREIKASMAAELEHIANGR